MVEATLELGLEEMAEFQSLEGILKQSSMKAPEPPWQGWLSAGAMTLLNSWKKTKYPAVTFSRKIVQIKN